METLVLPTVSYTSALAAGPASSPAGSVSVEASALDAAGNSVIVGSMTGTVNFNSNPSGTPATLTSNGGLRSIFAAEYGPQGNLLWAHLFGNSGGDDDGFGVAVDSARNVYLTGEFSGALNFNPNPAGPPRVFAAPNREDIFVLKLDPSGNLVWAQQAASPTGSQAIGYGVAVDAAQNVFITGSFGLSAGATATFGSTTLTAGAASDPFVARLDPNGNWVWAKDFHASAGGGSNIIVHQGIGLDSGDNVYTTGSFKGTMDFDPGSGVVSRTSTGGYNGYVSRLDSAGNYFWVHTFGGTGVTQATAVAVDTAHLVVYAYGEYSGTVNFNAGFGAAQVLTSTGNLGEFVAQFSLGGASTNFVRDLGVTFNTNDVGRGALALDTLGNLDIVAQYPSTAKVGGITLTNFVGVGAFFAQMTQTGQFVAAASLPDVGNAIFSRDSNYANLGIAANASGNVVVTGSYSSTSARGLNNLTLPAITAGNSNLYAIGITVTQSAAVKAGDYNGDGRSEVTVYDPVQGAYLIGYQTGQQAQYIPWGLASDNPIPVPGDFNGDKRTEIAVYDPVLGAFSIGYQTGQQPQYIPWGVAADHPIPIAGDFNGDGRTDIAVYDPVLGAFSIGYQTGQQPQYIPWGVAADHPIPIAGDFNGDGRTDIAVYDPVLGAFSIGYQTGQQPQYIPWGVAADHPIPVAGDFNGDGRTDIAIYDPVQGAFLIGYQTGQQPQYIPWGVAANNAVPVAGDFNGDRRTDIAVYDPVLGAFSIGYQTGQQPQYIPWGTAADNSIAIGGQASNRSPARNAVGATPAIALVSASPSIVTASAITATVVDTSASTNLIQVNPQVLPATPKPKRPLTLLDSINELEFY